MIRLTQCFCLGLASFTLTGCCGGGYWSREGGAQTQGAYLSAMFSNIDASTLGDQRRPAFKPPASLAVVQVGEVSPPAVMMTKLREHAHLFRRVEALPSATENESWRGRNGDPNAPEVARAQVNTLRNMAASIGMDYLLLVGGTIDQRNSDTNLAVFNLTIVGAYVVPSRETQAVMKLSGALIDVRTGQVVSISSADAQDHRFATLASTDRDTGNMIEALRAKVGVGLADAVVTDCVRVGDPTPITAPITTSVAPPTNPTGVMAQSPTLSKTLSIPADPAFASAPGRRFQGR